MIEFIVDDSPLKQGRYTPGMHIPVLPAQALYERRPDVVVVLAAVTTIVQLPEPECGSSLPLRFCTATPNVHEPTARPDTVKVRDSDAAPAASKRNTAPAGSITAPSQPTPGVIDSCSIGLVFE